VQNNARGASGGKGGGNVRKKRMRLRGGGRKKTFQEGAWGKGETKLETQHLKEGTAKTKARKEATRGDHCSSGGATTAQADSTTPDRGENLVNPQTGKGLQGEKRETERLLSTPESMAERAGDIERGGHGGPGYPARGAGGRAIIKVS